MCNSIHADHQPIAATGIGWKIFERRSFSCFDTWPYKSAPSGWINWRSSLSAVYADGFCFFLTRREARRALKNLKQDINGLYQRHNIKKIQYRRGVCQQDERNMIDIAVHIALCKSFRIVKKETP